MLFATFRTDLDAVALERAFTVVPGMEIEAERIAAHSTEWTMPCIWVTAEDFTFVDEALSNDPSVDRIVGTDEFADEKYYQIDWADAVDERVTSYIDEEASILEASATDDGWRLQIRFVSRDQFDTFRERLTERGHSFELLALTEPGSPRISFGDLTPSQRDALVTALEHGYFKIPREISTRELADELGISHQTLSEILRRGTEKPVDSTLTTTSDPDAQ